MNLNDKRIVITGGASGMGKSMVQEFLKQGAKVVAVDINEERLSEIATEQATANLITLTADISKRDTNEKMIDLAIEKFGGLDVLINNAGVLDDYMNVGEITDEVWDRVMQINLTAPMYASRKAISYFLENSIKGNIINIGSVGSIAGSRGGVAYVASKHALAGFTKNTAQAYGRNGIRCNLIAPGAVETNIAESVRPETINQKGLEVLMAGIGANIAQGNPKDIANVALFLASEDSSFINGAIIVADSGWTAY